MRTVRIPACAKVNLQLHIVGRRADGYHELRTVFQTIGLHDTLTVERTRTPAVRLECDHPALATGRENLVWRALAAMRRELRQRDGFHASLNKLIPVGRGLGGGSADAAAALLAAQRLTGWQVPQARLREIAAELGADVPFFLLGGRALGVGRGDEIYPLADMPRYSVLVVSPRGMAVNTREAYGWLRARRGLTNAAVPRKISSFCALCWSSQAGPLVNDFEPAVFARHPRLRQLKRRLLQTGALDASLAGSGSAVYGIYQHPAKARRAAESFPREQTFVVETLSRGEYRQAVWLRT
jgi:4-diphosphocytidyl-2-C-methyl-D-erythritol kinase